MNMAYSIDAVGLEASIAVLEQNHNLTFSVAIQAAKSQTRIAERIRNRRYHD